MDFIIPCHSKDYTTVNLSVNGIKNINSSSRIFLVSKDDLKIENTIYVSEKMFDKFITKEMIKNIWKQKNKKLFYRSKWLYQQFLKLLCHKVIEDITQSYVLVDSDTIFLRDVNFNEDLFYYSIANEYHLPYLPPIKKILNIKNTIGFSTINHHMIFNKENVEMMIDEVENRFNNSFVNVVLNTIDYNESSCFSEWDLYANYMILNHSKSSVHRQLKWTNLPFIPTEQELSKLSYHFDFVSCHAYERGIE